MKKLFSLALAAAPLALAACGAGEGTATLKLMDAPPDGIKAVNVKVLAMAVHVAEEGKKDDASDDDSGGWKTLEVNKTIDLVAHQGEGAAETLGDLPLPEGKITQIRLVIDTEKPENNTAKKADDSTCNLDVAKVAKKGIKINHPFKALENKAGAKHEVIVDFELDKSLKASGGCWELEPKLKLHKVKTDGKDQAIE